MMVWVHDYQLILVADCLRRMQVKRQTGFFLHILPRPWTASSACPGGSRCSTPCSRYDLVGFPDGARPPQLHAPRAHAQTRCPCHRPGCRSRCFTPEREVLVGTFPISIDFKQFARTAASREVEDQA